LVVQKWVSKSSIPGLILRSVKKCKERAMKKLNLIAMVTITAGMIFLASSSAKSTYCDFTFEGTGYLSTFFVGSGADIHLDWFDPDTAFGARHDVLNVGGDYYVGMQSSNPLAIDRVVIVKDSGSNNGFANFIQSYSDSPGHDLLGSFGTSASSTGLIILCSSGFSSAVVADASFEIGQYVERFNPYLISTEVNVASVLAEGLGCSQMSAQLYESWYSPSYHIFEYWEDAWVGNSETGFVDVQLTGDEGLDVDISSSWTTPSIYIEVFTIL